MSLVKFFKSGLENADSEDSLAFSILETKVSLFMCELDVEIIRTNGPYATYFPPSKEGAPSRVMYTAGVEYIMKR